ncbi:MAG: DUF58 domain-containing protein [Bdellovibrionales bacterium]
MVQVQRPSWKDLFWGKFLYQYRNSQSFSATDYIKQGIYLPKSMLFRNFINPFNLILLVIAGCFVFGFFKPVLFSVAIGLSAYLLCSFYSLNTTAQTLVIDRKVEKDHFTEGDEIEVTIELRNKSTRAVTNFLVREVFSGSSELSFCHFMNQKIGPQSVKRVKYFRRCDAGMGEYRFSDLVVTLSDPLGIFCFNVKYENDLDIYVGPKVQDLKNLIFKPSHSSRGFGQHEVISRGENVNFEGIRSYEPGDPIRHIAWKLSAKKQKICFCKTFRKPGEY